MGKYIDLGDLADQISSQALNAGQSFLAGKVTNVFNDIGRVPNSDLIVGGNDIVSESANVLSSVAGLGVNATQAAISAKAAVNSIAQSITSAETVAEALIEMGTQVIIQNATQLAGDYVENHTSAIAKLPSMIQSYAIDYFNAYKLSLAELLKDQCEAVNDKNTKSEDDADENSKTEFINKAKTQIINVTNKASKMAEQIPTYINMITTYMVQGPHWVESKMDEFVTSKTEEIEKMIDKQWQLDKQAYDSFAKKQGDKIGAKLTERYNNELRKQAQKLQALKRKAEEKLKIEAKKVLQKAKLIVMSKLGINLPI